jgi:hypothetical protein
MALEWIKDTAEKAAKVVSDAGTSLLKEAQAVEHKLLGSEEKKSSEPNKTDAAQQKKDESAGKDTEKKAGPASSSPSALSADQPALHAAAMRAEMKDKNISQQAIPKYDGSILDTISHFASQAKETLTSSTTSVLNFISNPVAVSIGAGVSLGQHLVKVAENVYESADKHLKVSKVVGETAEKIKDEYSKLFDDSTPTSSSKPADTPAMTLTNLEFSNPFTGEVARVSSVDDSNLPKDLKHWLFNENEKPSDGSFSDSLFSFTNDKNQKTEITALPGHVRVEKRDENGNVKTIVDKSTGKTMVLQGNESVTIENGKEVVKGDGYTVSWDEQGRRHIMLDNNKELIRDGNSVKIIDKTGAANLTLQNHVLDSNHQFGFTDKPSEIERITKEKQAELKAGDVYILAIPGSGTRAIFKDATFDVRDNIARLETNDHQVFQLEMKDNQVFLRRDGQLLPINDEQLKTLIKAEDGKFKIGNLLIDPEKLKVLAPGCHREGGDSCSPYELDLRNWHQHVRRPDGHDIGVAVKPGTNETTVTDGNTTYQNNNHDSVVAVTTTPATDATAGGTPAQPSVIKVDLDKQTIDTPKLIDTPDKTVIKDTNTVIEKDHTVKFDDGPTVNPDGSVRVDKDTFIDKDLTVHSKNWESSAARDNGIVSTAAAQGIAVNISNKANSVFGMARSGKVRWTEVAALNSALGDVLRVMGAIPADHPAYSLLVNSYGLLVEAINVATPKAQVTESAIQKGINDPSAIKALEQGLDSEEMKRKRMAA